MRGMRHPTGSKPAGNAVTGSARPSTTRSLRSRLVATLTIMGLRACLMESERVLRQAGKQQFTRSIHSVRHTRKSNQPRPGRGRLKAQFIGFSLGQTEALGDLLGRCAGRMAGGDQFVVAAFELIAGGGRFSAAVRFAND